MKVWTAGFGDGAGTGVWAGPARHGLTVNVVVLVAVPAGVVTVIGPDVALSGTIAYTVMFDPTWMNGDGVPLNETALTPPSLMKPAPEIATTAPGHWLPSAGVCVSPLVGAKPEMVAPSADPATRNTGTSMSATPPRRGGTSGHRASPP